jgi:hypothetical protein
MTSSKRPKLPYPYYFLPFCRPGKLRNTRENLGEVLRGDRITNTPYVVRQFGSCDVSAALDSSPLARFATAHVLLSG